MVAGRGADGEAVRSPPAGNRAVPDEVLRVDVLVGTRAAILPSDEYSTRAVGCDARTLLSVGRRAHR